jgi:hypothetical protein
MQIIVGLVVVLLVGAVLHRLWWIVAATAGHWLRHGGRRLLRAHRARMDQRAHDHAELLARGEIQRRWYLAGDMRGTYGRYIPLA